MNTNEIINKLMVTLLDEVIPDAEVNVKNDVGNQLAAMLINDASISNVEQIIGVAQELAKRYKDVPRDVANVAAYLAEVLDLPPVELSPAEQELIGKLVEKLASSKLAVVTIDDENLKEGLPSFNDVSNGGFSFNGGSGCIISFNEDKTMLFSFNETSIIRAELNIQDGVAVAKSLPNYTVQNLIEDVNSANDTPFQIKLMEQRENITLDDINNEKVIAYLDNNKAVLINNPNINAQSALNLVINNYALENGLQLSDKRITIPNATEIMQTIHKYLVDINTPSANDLDIPEVTTTQEVVQEDPAPTQEVEPVTGIEDAVHIVIENLKKQPSVASDLLQNSDNDYNGALITYVVNTVPTVLRNPAALNEVQTQEVSKLVTTRSSEIYQLVEEYRQVAKQRYEDTRNKFTTEEVIEVINSHPSHVDFMNQLNVSANYIAAKIVEYFNDNGIDLSLSTTRENTILNTLYMLALYEYSIEAIGNEEFRRNNVPSSENIIFDTKFFKTLIKKNFERIDVLDDDVVFSLNKDLESAKSYLDLPSTTLSTILNLLGQKQCMRIMSMYLIRGIDIPSHEFNAETDELNIQLSYATLAVISSGKAEILYIQNSDNEPTVARSELVDKVTTRMKLIDFLDMNV